MFGCSAERDKEAELGEAIRRRDAAIDKVQEANTSLMVSEGAPAAQPLLVAEQCGRTARAVIIRGSAM